MKNKVDFNREYANSVTKEQFIKDHEHHAKDVDLSEAWEGLQDKPPVPAKVKETK